MMRKGFGFYSPHETTAFLMKAMLLSFWVGIDIIAVLAGSAFSVADLMRHALLTILVGAVLIGGTVFSALFVWATGSLNDTAANAFGNDKVTTTLLKLKQQPQHLIGAGALMTSLFLLGAASGLSYLQSDTTNAVGRADPVMASKCAEIARLEKKLFQSDEQLVMAQCLVQYDAKYAALRNADARQK